jgi:hypothetical protein
VVLNSAYCPTLYAGKCLCCEEKSKCTHFSSLQTTASAGSATTTEARTFASGALRAGAGARRALRTPFVFNFTGPAVSPVLSFHQSKYPYYDVAGNFHPEHYNVLRNTHPRGIVMSGGSATRQAISWLQASKTGNIFAVEFNAKKNNDIDIDNDNNNNK